jgi:serine/threonine protein kinase
MGEVYRARDTRLDRDVALKVLPERVASNPEALARFERPRPRDRQPVESSTPQVVGVQVSPDGRRYAYRLSQILSDLCVVRGVPGAPAVAPGPRP